MGVTRGGVCLRHTCVTAMTVTLESAYLSHADELIRYATMMIGPDDAAGVVTDAMVSVFTRDSGDVPVSNLRAYLFRAVHHRVIDVSRAETQRRDRESRWQRHRPADSVPDEAAIDARRLLACLSDQQRVVVFLTYWCDLKPSEVAETLDVSEGTIRKQLARARARLKEAISD